MPLRALTDAWRRRYWRPDPEPMAQWAGLAPIVVVTGASEGLGLAIAQRYARRGRDVALVARRAAPLEAAAADISATYGVKAVALPLDAASPDSPATLESALRQRGFFVDVLVNNAGIGAGGPYSDQSPDQIARLLDLNVRALSLHMRHFLPGMCVRGRGGVLNIASLGGYGPGPYQAAYYASKAYVISLTEAVAWESRGQGVRIAVFVPGPVRTRFHARMGADHALYRWVIPASSAWMAAGSAVRWFEWGRTVITPGVLAPLTALAMRLTPHPILLPIVAALLKPRGRRNDAGH